VVAKLREIENRGNPLNDAVRSIASAAGEQRTNIERFTRSVGELNQVTQAVAANAEESAAAAAQLNAQSGYLMDAIESLRTLVGAEAGGEAKRRT